MHIAIKYTLFALVATVANLLGQESILRIYQSSHVLVVSVLVGTFVGLITKYILDKKYIFEFKVRDVRHDTGTFLLYTVMGIATTAIFWAFEFGFQHQFETKQMRYLGAVLGLAIGYYVKYRLDKRFVFVVQELQ